MTFTVGSLFSGIGGIDLGLERAGMTVAWQSETDKYASRVLRKRFPNVPNLGDIKRINWVKVEPVDVICGGYPCQPFSVAGKRRGTEDPRHLWPYMRNALSILRPRYALLENVPGHLRLGFGNVLADLARLRYDAEWDCIPAAAVGAPHLRYRLFVVAYTDRYRPRREQNVRRMGRMDDHNESLSQHRERSRQKPINRSETLADTNNERQTRRTEPPWRTDPRVTSQQMADADRASRRTARPASQTIFGPRAFERLGRCGSSSGEHWTVEPAVGRVADGIPARLDRLKTLGNAVVPQVAEWIGTRILEREEAPANTYAGAST